MSALGTFADSAKSLSRNPLGIIALFIVLIYAFAALTLGLNSSLMPAERLPIIWFLVAFPFIVLGVFGWLVSRHHEKLYAPGDYKSDDGFLEGVKARLALVREFEVQQRRVNETVEQVISSQKGGRGNNWDIAALVQEIQEEISSATNIVIDAGEFLNNGNSTFELPAALFDTVGDLTDAVYYKIAPKVKPYEYGFTWLMRDQKRDQILRTARMITGAGPGKNVPDTRALAEVGIGPGTHLKIERPGVTQHL